MLTKCSALMVATMSFVLIVGAQTTPTAKADAELRRRIQKQFLLNQSEGRLRDMDVAAARVLLRLQIAAWLWDEEPEYFGRAEELATAAIDDLYENRVEISSVYFSALSSRIFALLELRSPKTANALKNKYELADSEQMGILDQLIKQAGNDKAAVDVAIRSMSKGSTFDLQLPVVIQGLVNRKSGEVSRLLDAVTSLEDRNPGRFGLSVLRAVSPYFAQSSVQPRTAERFARIIVRRAQAVSVSPFADFDAWLDLVNLISPMIGQKAPALESEVEVLRVVLTSRISQRSRVDRERNARIENSTDKLEALIREAGDAQDPTVKYGLLRWAVRLAIDKGVFRRAADLAVELAGLDMSSAPISKEVQQQELGQLLESVTTGALKSGDDGAARYSVERQADNDRRAAGYLEVFDFYVKKRDYESARGILRNVSQVIANVERPSRRAILFFKLIPMMQGFEPRTVYEINVLASRSINSMPSLAVEDKPGTSNFARYVAEIMDINWNLLPMLRVFAKEDRFGASDLASRIEKREIKFLADFVVGVASLDEMPP